MFIYWAMFTVLTLGAVLTTVQGTSRWRPMFFALAAVPTALMTGLRWQIGPDWGSYVGIYEYTSMLSLSSSLTHEDPGFYFLNWLLHRFRAPFWVINIPCAVMFTAGLAAFCRRQPNPWLAFLIAFPYLVIVVGMSGIRQSAAIGILCFALNAYERNHLGRCIVLILFAALFHASALLMAPLCAISYSRNRLSMVVGIVLVLVVGWLLFVKSFGTYATRYSSESLQSGGTWYRLAMNVLPALIFLRYRWRFDLDEPQHLLWRNLSLCSLLLVPLAIALPSNTAVDRFVLYLFPLQFFVLSRVPIIFSEVRQASAQLTLLLIFYAAVVQVVFLEFGTYASFYVPYHSVFDRANVPLLRQLR